MQAIRARHKVVVKLMGQGDKCALHLEHSRSTEVLGQIIWAKTSGPRAAHWDDPFRPWPNCAGVGRCADTRPHALKHFPLLREEQTDSQKLLVLYCGVAIKSELVEHIPFDSLQMYRPR